MHPMQTKSLPTLMRPRSAVTNHQRQLNSPHVHTNRTDREFFRTATHCPATPLERTPNLINIHLKSSNNQQLSINQFFDWFIWK
jgi:hypothetical protein